MLAEHCLAAWLIEPGRVELRQVPVPRPGPGQVVLRIERALAGGTDRKAFARGHPQIPMPGPFGHRYAGTVAAVGPGTSSWDVGEPVMGVHSAPCLGCPFCRKGRWNLCPDVMREKVLGAFAQYLTVPAPVARQNLYVRPAFLSAEHATLLEPLACAVHALDLLDWRGVDRVLILGLGSMGLLLAQLLPRYTAAGSAGAGRHADRLQLARRFRLDPVWDVTHQPITELTSDRFDLVIECTGKLDGWQQAFDLVRPGGQVLFFGGVPRGTTFAVDTYRLHYEEIRLLGSFHFSPTDVARARELLLQDRLQLDPLISGCLPLTQLDTALRRLEQGLGLQYAIDPWSSDESEA
jgi:L-iditol 2-dehydrogenase